MQERIESKVITALTPAHLELVNESHNHASGPRAETHFKLTLVSTQFAGQGLVQRHRRVYEVLATELKEGVHALTLQLFTPDEWTARGGVVPQSPPCLGGSRHDK